jgi:flagellar biogenesis protein FliO
VRRLRAPSVIAMALAATLLTGSVFADSDPPSPPEATTATGLPVRPTKTLTFEPATTGTGSAWKLGIFAVLAAGGLWVWKQRGKKTPGQEQAAQLHVLRRTTIGVRSELLLLELEGQRLLIGVTPSSMQTLYLLPDTSPDESAAEAPSERRISALLEARIAPQEERREVAKAPAAISKSDDDATLEGQAAGLRAIGSRR